MEYLETTPCPAVVGALTVADGTVEKTCGADAVELDRFDMPSTDGFVEHVRTRCTGTPRHVVTVRVGQLGLLDELEAMYSRPAPVPSPYTES